MSSGVDRGRERLEDSREWVLENRPEYALRREGPEGLHAMDTDRIATARQPREEGNSYALIGKMLGASDTSIYQKIVYQNR